MSWIEKISTPCIITTGDGKEYRPSWKNASKQQEYNLTQFNFPSVPGTKVDRREPQGLSYNLEIYFQGEDHLDQAEAFRISANDKRPWTISHPFYGDKTVHPVSLSFDQTALNVTTITGTIIETLTDDFPQAVVIPKDQVSDDKEALDETVALSFEQNVSPSASDANAMGTNNTNLYNLGAKVVPDTTYAEEYFNFYNEATAKVANASAEPLAAIRAMNAVISYPGLFSNSVFNRLDLFDDQLDALIARVTSESSANEKRIFEANGTCLVSAIALAAANPSGDDYLNATDIIRAIDQIIAAFDLFISTLNDLQSDLGSDPGAYLADPAAIRSLYSLINYTISNLFDLSLEAKQERSILLEDDTNLIQLTHRLYGLDAEDVNMERLMNQNSIGPSEVLGIAKGRRILYYV